MPLVQMLTERPLDNAGVEAEFVLGQSDEQPVDMDAVLQPVKENEDAMAIDEEGRPQFAPSRDIVRLILPHSEPRIKV